MDGYSPLSFPCIALRILAWRSWLILVDVRGGDAMQKNGKPLDGANMANDNWAIQPISRK
jgi:hypothetical protein